MKKVILDVDTGVDDALAILLAMRSPEVEILGITVVGGNVDVQQSAKNTGAALSHLHPFVKDRYETLPPIAVGQALNKGVSDASNVHGPDGLGGVCEKYLKPSVKIRSDALSLFKELIMVSEPNSVTLITTGPLTNVAYWIEQCPETIKNLKQIVSMGGVFFQAGNRSPVAEFNIYTDPLAARKVVEFCRTPISIAPYKWFETVPLTFVGLDVTHQVRFQRQVLEDALKKNSEDPNLVFIKEITGHYMDFYYRNEELDGCYLHDPLAVAYVIDPSLCEARQFHVEVETRGEFTTGMTVADNRPTRLYKDKMKEVTWVCYKVDAERFEEMFYKRALHIGE